VRTRAVDDRSQCAWWDECKWREQANVPFHLAFALRDLSERLNAARNNIVDPGSRLGYGEENSALGLLFEGRLGLGPMQNSLTEGTLARSKAS
jgi:hypothetical protein